MATDADHEAILRSLLEERTVDIITTGRRTGRPRTTEIWTTVFEGRTYIAGSPNASKPGVQHTPRDWMANLLAEPAFTIRLKASVGADLPATAAPVSDADERRRLLSAPHTAYYRDAVTFEAALAHSPIVRVTFTGDAAWLNDAIRTGTA